MIMIDELKCSVRSAGNKNTAGEYTLCGSDLQLYIDALMPPPPVSMAASVAGADATLHRADRNGNDGAGLRHELVPLDGNHSNDIVVQFSEEAIQGFLENGELVSATLRLSVDDGATDGGAWRQAVTVRPLPDAFAEGNGDAAMLDLGEGTGTTWYCAEDADIGDQVRGCEQYWSRHRWAVARWVGAKQLEPEELVDDDGRTVTRLRWDVSEDVAAGIHGWILRRRRDQHDGHLAFHSREGAADLRDPSRAPALLLER